MLLYLYCCNHKTKMAHIEVHVPFLLLLIKTERLSVVSMTNFNRRSSRLHIVLLCAALFIFSVVWFLIDGSTIEAGGDAVGRWGKIRYFLDHGMYPKLNQHSLRWSINLLLILVLSVVNTPHPIMYHLIMAGIGGVVFATIFLLVRQKSASLLQDLSTLILVVSMLIMSIHERTFSQLLPSPFLVLYMLLGILALQRGYAAEQTRKRRRLYFTIAGFLCLLTYGAKLTSLWLIVPVSLYVIFRSIREKRYWDAFFFLAPLFAGFVVETVLIGYYTSFYYGRPFFVISSATSHGEFIQGSIKGLQQPAKLAAGIGFENFSDYLLSPRKYLDAYGGYAFVIYSAVACSVLQLFAGWKRDRDNYWAWIIIGFFLLQSYMVVSFSPYVFPEQYTMARYQYPLLLLCMVFWLRQVISLLDHLERRFHQAASLIISVVVLVCCSAFFTNNILISLRNYGVVKTVFHQETLKKWLGHQGKVGYRAPLLFDGKSVSLTKSMAQLKRSRIVNKYVRWVYHLEYCHYTHANYYMDQENIYGLCEKWGEQQSIMYYVPVGYTLSIPEDLISLGKYENVVRIMKENSR